MSNAEIFAASSYIKDKKASLIALQHTTKSLQDESHQASQPPQHYQFTIQISNNRNHEPYFQSRHLHPQARKDGGSKFTYSFHRISKSS